MTYEEFSRQVRKAGLSIKEFSDLLKLHRSTIPNYSKDRKIPTHFAVIAALMAEMKEHRIDFKTVLARIEIEPNKPRGAVKGTFGGSKQKDMFDERPL